MTIVNNRYKKFCKGISKISEDTRCLSLLDKSWFEFVDNSKSNIRELIGGDSTTKSLELKSIQEEIHEDDRYNNEEIERFIEGLSFTFIRRLENHLQESIDDWAIFRFLRSPYHTTTDNRTIKTSKYLRSFARKNFPSELHRIDDNLSKMGKIWNEYKIDKLNVDVTLTTYPTAFIYLGHCTVDDDSCFMNGKEREYDKINLAQTSDTFVVLITNSDTDNIIGRCWGIYEHLYRALVFCNYYTKYISAGTARNILKMFSESILECDVYPKYDNGYHIMLEPGLYYNGDAMICADPKYYNGQTITIDPYYNYESPEEFVDDLLPDESAVTF